MNEERQLERDVTSSFAATAPPRAPHGLLDPIVTSVGRTRQHPRWLANLKEPPMRHASRVVVGSPTARVAAIGAATLFMAVLATGAIVAGAQSPAPAPPEEAAPQPPTEFTGTACWYGPEVAPDRAGTETTLEVGDEGVVLTRLRRGAWQNHNDVSMSDPRLQGIGYQTYESDAYAMPGSATGPIIDVQTLSIVNEDGAWVSTRYRATVDGSDTAIPAVDVFIGQGAYEGLIAIMETAGPCSGPGVILDGAPVPEPYIPEQPAP